MMPWMTLRAGLSSVQSNSGSDMVYLFLGDASPAKEIQLKKIRKEFIAQESQDFNLDILFASDLSLKGLQEKLLLFPVRNPGRMILIKDAQNLKPEVKDFLLDYFRKPYKHIILVLDIEQADRRDVFVQQACRFARVLRFQESAKPDAFSLSRFISSRRPDYALKILNQLLKDGERPERILGGLRYTWERESASPLETKRRLKLLLACDVDIKTGKLKASFALEKLVISLCARSA